MGGLLTRIAWLLIGGAFVLMIGLFSLSDLIAVTGGRVGLMAEVLGVSCLASAVVAAALVLVLIAGERLQRRLGAAATPRTPASPGRWFGAAAALAWVGFVTAPFLAQPVVAGDWAEVGKLTGLVGGLIVGFLAAVMLPAILIEARRRG